VETQEHHAFAASSILGTKTVCAALQSEGNDMSETHPKAATAFNDSNLLCFASNTAMLQLL